MRRREFIMLLGGAAVAWPFAARAQESRQVRLVGIFFNYGGADDPVMTAEIGAFKEALWRLGWSEGRNVRFEEHLNPPDSATRRKLAKELVAIKPDVILTSSTPATTAVFAETRTIPVVFVSVSDPVGSGFAVSLSHPDGNVTGFTNFEATIGQSGWNCSQRSRHISVESGSFLTRKRRSTEAIIFFNQSRLRLASCKSKRSRCTLEAQAISSTRS